MHTLLTATAEHEARAQWEVMGARGYQDARASVLQALYADWGMEAARAAARMRLERVRFVGLSRAQVRAAARTGGGRQRPQREEETVGHYAVVQGAYIRSALQAAVLLPVPKRLSHARAAEMPFFYCSRRVAPQQQCEAGVERVDAFVQEVGVKI